MKLFAAFLTALFFNSSLFANEIYLGGTLPEQATMKICKETYDIGRRSILPESVRVRLESDQIQVHILVNHIECSKNDQTFYWKRVGALASSYHQTPKGIPFEKRRLSGSGVITSAHSTGSQMIALNPDSRQSLIFTWTLAEILNDDKYSNIDKDGRILIQMDYFHLFEYQIKKQGEFLEPYKQATGSYPLRYQAIYSSDAGWSLAHIN